MELKNDPDVQSEKIKILTDDGDSGDAVEGCRADSRRIAVVIAIMGYFNNLSRLQSADICQNAVFIVYIDARKTERIKIPDIRGFINVDCIYIIAYIIAVQVGYFSELKMISGRYFDGRLVDPLLFIGIILNFGFG